MKHKFYLNWSTLFNKINLQLKNKKVLKAAHLGLTNTIMSRMTQRNNSHSPQTSLNLMASLPVPFHYPPRADNISEFYRFADCRPHSLPIHTPQFFTYTPCFTTNPESHSIHIFIEHPPIPSLLCCEIISRPLFPPAHAFTLVLS